MGNDKKQEDKKEDQAPARSSSSPPPPSSETSRIQNLIRMITILKSTDSDDLSTSDSNSNLEGGRIRPIGCILTKSPRLDITVTKSTEICITLIGQNHAILGNPANQGWGENRKISNVDYRIKLLRLGISAILTYCF